MIVNENHHRFNIFFVVNLCSDPFWIPFYCLPFKSCQKLATKIKKKKKTLEIRLCNTHPPTNSIASVFF